MENMIGNTITQWGKWRELFNQNKYCDYFYELLIQINKMNKILFYFHVQISCILLTHD